MSSNNSTTNAPASTNAAAPAKAPTKAPAKSPAANTARTATVRLSTATRAAERAPITLESAVRLGPTVDVVSKIIRIFEVAPVPVAEIREMVEENLVKQAEAMGMGEKGSEITFGRIVGAYVGAAHGAAQTYDTRRARARELTSKMNENRDEDRDGPSGFESRVEQAQEFAATLALQALAAISAAEGACSAYEHITGNVWKPYVSQTQAAPIGRQAAAARMSAFD